jgi:hypothetical protein
MAPVSMAAQSNTMNAPAVQSNPADRNDPFTRLILLDELTPATILLALVVSFIWGAAHAMTLQRAVYFVNRIGDRDKGGDGDWGWLKKRPDRSTGHGRSFSLFTL